MAVDRAPSVAAELHASSLGGCQVPVTCDNYLDLNFPEGIPEDYGAEFEASLPSYLQDSDAPELK